MGTPDVAASTTDATPKHDGPQDGPKRTYTIRRPSIRGVGFYPGPGGAAVWSEPVQKAPYAKVPVVGDTMTLHVSAVEVPGHTLFYDQTRNYGDGPRHDYKRGERKVRIHDAAMPVTPEGMTAPAHMLVCSLPLVPSAASTTTEAAATEVEDPMQPVDGLVEKTRDLVKQFRQVILYGPPGTGKTRLARQVALSLLDPARATRDVLEDSDLLGDALKAFSGDTKHAFNLVVFHPSYEYEQFIGGITPKVSGGNLEYAVEDGVFLRLCNAERAVLVIDEINRGNLSKLLGELVHALEYRGSEVTLPFPRQSGPEKGRPTLIIPRELFVIATMNSSDRSIGHIDIAVRRRFGMVRVKPNSDVVLEIWRKDRFGAEGEAYAKRLVGLMESINKHLGNKAGHDGAELGVGQSYFLPDDENMEFQEAKKVVQNRWKYQVHPLLAEYDVMFGVPLPEHLKDEDLDTVLRALEGRGEAAATS